MRHEIFIACDRITLISVPGMFNVSFWQDVLSSFLQGIQICHIGGFNLKFNST
jgi:hypothetical protein